MLALMTAEPGPVAHAVVLKTGGIGSGIGSISVTGIGGFGNTL
jgi:hypothetical protein